ncbi:hypothetical protein BJI69_00260 [Luteibacter rhizovicinus DSM 16549]|uniref:Uncharacterized protein n=1 Tax=Luteibacter rhizovicinus DSM 16549 TaxID=1440763 RepID=A0A0G9HCS7_9GAMM|nr:hypothetical protein [Luteibacter rhizovicinus]APG02488.1 hypothetical protein BJI69_00260 [Luteibacter rhizovicinus DSM 16549]KLD67286.1 hypothetical protein Y883_08545 [Luteibacter rhizovicinus DSM 16549]KLD74735.1 hypothetical protein Y886_30915 [Xanthomonas hyacinthi DSM 19077]
MKKTSYALVVPALILSALLVSGCGAFRSKKDWDRAQQEAPLEIPPGLDTPSTSAALVIPEVGSGAAAANAAATNAAPVSDGFVLADDVETAYKRIGEQLSQGDLGNVIAHDDTNHTYQIAAKPGRPEARPGLFRRMFGGGKDNQDAKDAPASAQGASHTVVLTVNPSGTGSEIRAQGDADGVRRVVDALKSRMGSK